MILAWFAPALPAFAQPFLPAAYPPPPVITAPETRHEAAFCASEDQVFDREAEALIARRLEEERALFAAAAPPLHPDRDLTVIARERSCDMAEGAPFSHTDERGNFLAGGMVKERFGPYGATGENIMEMSGSSGFGPEEFAKIAVDGWMKSPGHRANILNPRFDTSGIGVAKVGDHAFATQVFHGLPSHHKPGKNNGDDP